MELFQKLVNTDRFFTAPVPSRFGQTQAVIRYVGSSCTEQTFLSVFISISCSNRSRVLCGVQLCVLGTAV